MRALPTRRRVVPTAVMALGFSIALAGSFGFTPVSSADEGTGTDYTTTTEHQSGGYESTTTVPETTTTVAETTTTVAETTTTVPETTTTVPETTTTVVKTTTTTVPETTTTIAQTTTTVAQTTTTVPVSVSPATTVAATPVVEALAVTGSSGSVPMIGLGVALFVIGLIVLEMRAAQEA
jgi:hypothetical protein